MWVDYDALSASGTGKWFWRPRRTALSGVRTLFRNSACVHWRLGVSKSSPERCVILVPVRFHPQYDRFDLETALLSPLSLLYWMGWGVYEWVYKLGLKRPMRPHSPVIVVGNLTTGGMGKTPITECVAKTLQRTGHKVVISASGYGSPRAKEASVAPEGPLDPAEWGDEPALLRDLLPDTPMIVGRGRVRAAELAHERFADHVLLLDDGFQHKPLHKDITILVDPPHVRNPLVLPAGPYREPRNHRDRADILIPDQIGISLVEEYIVDGSGNRVQATSGTRVAVLTAIANPFRFTLSLERLGLKLADGRFLADHDPLTATNLLQGIEEALPVVVTLKDWVKLRTRPDVGSKTFWICRQVIELEPAEQLEALLRTKLNEIKAQAN